MRRLALLMALGAVLVTPAQAAAVPYLSFGEAARQLGRHLNRNYYVVPGTLDSVCERYRRNKVGCDFSVWLDNGDLNCGYGQVVETWRWYRSRIPFFAVCD